MASYLESQSNGKAIVLYGQEGFLLSGEISSADSPMTHDPDFERLLRDYYPAAIYHAEESIYGMWPNLNLAYVNRGWKRFAAANNGEPSLSLNWTIGCCIENAIAPALRPFFHENFSKCLREGRPWSHQYECSSADVYRSFVMVTYPLGVNEGLLVVNSLVKEAPHTRRVCEPFEDLYRDQHDLITQCCHCRRVKRCGPELAWDWVPAWVSSFPPNTSHGLCEPCSGFYYPKDRSHKKFPQTFQTTE